MLHKLLYFQIMRIYFCIKLDKGTGVCPFSESYWKVVVAVVVVFQLTLYYVVQGGLV